MSQLVLDRAGRRRVAGNDAGVRCRDHASGNKGHRYPADPPNVEEIVAVLRAAGDRPHGRRMRALIVILWRAGLRINEALELTEGDLDQARGALLVRRGKGGRRREVGMDALGLGSSWCRGARCGGNYPSGRSCASSPAPPAGVIGLQPPPARSLRRVAAHAGVRRRSRHTSYATPTRSKWRAKALPLIMIQRQLGHSDLGITSVYLQGIDSGEIIDTVHARRAPMVPASISLHL